MIAEDKAAKIDCIINPFSKNLEAGLQKNLYLEPADSGYKKYRNRKTMLLEQSDMKIIYHSSYHSCNHLQVSRLSVKVICFRKNKKSLRKKNIDRPAVPFRFIAAANMS